MPLHAEPAPTLTWLARLTGTAGSWRALAGLAVVYAVAFAVFYPSTVTISDEMSYIRQAQLIATGIDHETVTHPLTGEPVDLEIHTMYPVGTALALAPWIAIGEWQAAFMGSAFFLLLAVWLTGRWLQDEGLSPLGATVLLGFPPSMILGRVCMSEAPTLAWVALGFLLFWRGTKASRLPYWLAAGFVAGASLLFREGNVLLFLPLFLGTVLRRERSWWTLLLGGVVGVGLRLASSQYFWGDPFFIKEAGYGFSLSAISWNLGLYALALLVFVPGGLAAGLLYRGPRRPEVVATVALFVGFYLAYDYSGETSTSIKQIVLGPRFYVPLLPLLAFALADGIPRLGAQLVRRWPTSRSRLELLAGALLTLWVAGIAATTVGAHAVHSQWSQSQAEIREAIYEHTPNGSILIINHRSLSKAVSSIYGKRIVFDKGGVDARIANALLTHNEAVYLVMLDRSDSLFWRRDAFKNEHYVSSFRPKPQKILDLRPTRTDRLRIWQAHSKDTTP